MSSLRGSRRLLLALATFGVAAALLAVAALRPREFRPRPAALAKTLEAAPVAVAPGVYLLGKSEPAAVYLVETSEGLVLIDSGLEANAAGVRRQIAEVGFDVAQLRAILLTHVHADHSLGADHLRKLTGAKVYAGRGDAEALRRGGPREMFFSTFHMPDRAPHPSTVDVELAGDETIEFGATRFLALAAPGHTTGSICYLLERPDLRVLFTGDVVQNLSRPEQGLMGTYAAHLSPLYGGDVRDYLASLRRLRDLPLPDLILPGHPRMDPMPQNPRLREDQWHRLLDTGIAELEKLLARYEADGADFLDGTPRELLPGLHYFGNLGPAALYCLVGPKGLFLFDAPGGAALTERLSERLGQLGLAERKVTAVLLTSADKEATAGLTALVQQTGCAVVAPARGLEQVRTACPPGAKLLTEADLATRGWLDVTAIPLEGRGTAPIAYQLTWAGKKVLISGGIPVKPSEIAFEALHFQVTRPADYVKSLGRLVNVAPDPWLPAVPVHGQNANLYDQEWLQILAHNRSNFVR
jgi:glyoxylase-like metal-dependent hydrolase (beta-lactamase superfamily II)